MRTKQPQWRKVANLGDVNPVDYGGFFVYVDRTKVYGPEVELLVSPESDESGEGWTIYRAIIEANPRGEWWWDKLGEVATAVDMPVTELQRMAEDPNPETRGMVYQYLMSHFGGYEFDQYPRQYAKRSQLPRRVRRSAPASHPSGQACPACGMVQDCRPDCPSLARRIDT